MTKESRTWYGRVVSWTTVLAPKRTQALEAPRVGDPWGNKGQARLSQGRDTSSGSQQEGSERSPVGGSGEALP